MGIDGLSPCELNWGVAVRRGHGGVKDAANVGSGHPMTRHCSPRFTGRCNERTGHGLSRSKETTAAGSVEGRTERDNGDSTAGAVVAGTGSWKTLEDVETRVDKKTVRAERACVDDWVSRASIFGRLAVGCRGEVKAELEEAPAS